MVEPSRVSKRTRAAPTRYTADVEAAPAKKPRAAQPKKQATKPAAKAKGIKAKVKTLATKPAAKATPRAPAKAAKAETTAPRATASKKAASSAKPKAPKASPAPAEPDTEAAVYGIRVGDTAILPSSNGSGGYSIKRLPNGKWTCTCPDQKFRKAKQGLECKHITAVKAGVKPKAIIPAAAAPAKSSAAGGKKKSAPKKRKKRDEEEEDDDDDGAASLSPLAAAAAKYSKLTIKQLKHQLRHNVQVLSGNKGELVERCADAEVYGCLPRCPQCGGGRLKVQYVSAAHGGKGLFKCPGYYDDDHFLNCSFTSWDVERPAWTPAPAEE